MSERVIHLFREGSIITLCCHQAALDSRVSAGLGTYEPDAATCDGTLPEADDSDEADRG